MLPFVIKEGALPFKNLDYIFLPGIRTEVKDKAEKIKAYAVGQDGKMTEFELTLGQLTDTETEIILDGCLINYNRR
jgi:aconitate hydratase